MTSPKTSKVITIIVTDPSTLIILVSSQVKALLHNGWTISVICGSGDLSKLQIDPAVRVFQLNSLVRRINPMLDLLCLFRLAYLLNTLKPKTLIASTPKASFLGLIAASIIRVPRRIYQIRGARWEGGAGFSSKILKFTDYVSLLLSTELIAVAPSLKELYEANFSLRKEIIVLGKGSSKGVALDLFKPNSNFVLKLSDITFGFVGRLTSDKGIEDLVRIFTRLKSVYPNAKLEIVGSSDQTDPISLETSKMITNTTDIQIFENIQAEEVAQRMQGWALQIFPSRREGLPNAIIEAAACGTPTVAYRIGGVLDALPSAYSTFAVKVSSVEEACLKVKEVINSPDYSSIRVDFHNWARDNFSEIKVQSDFINYLEKKGPA